MIITGMDHFQSVCKRKLVEWYHKNRPEVDIDMSNVFVVWSCKTLQNYKCLVSTTISGDGIYAEYTFTLTTLTILIILPRTRVLIVTV